LFKEFLGAYLASGGTMSGVVRSVVQVDVLRSGIVLVPKPLAELPEIKRTVIMAEDPMGKALSKASTEDLLKIKGIVEQELRRREEAGKEA